MSTDVITPPRTMLEVYESLPEGTPVQLIKNKLIMSPSPLDIHQKILGLIFNRLFTFVEKHELGEVRVAPYDVHLDEQNIYQPDILFIAKENLHKIKENGLYGAPDLVIEILSPGTTEYDKKDKKEVYEQHGVKEYWIVDPETKRSEGFELKSGEYEAFGEENRKLALKILNLKVNIK